ncbi:2-methoxy-6-polyprenyl-1,4-benzoquinol methylase, mitochondrial [Methylobacterium crusticola]|uniref:2-methoxy-6-polyprenyl-1,4-benzoquinol methylase, mitochondrial n=1 Tax=Methylobacterium crusticola TaxID=1697972 RepID=A0ABQ4QZ28_9HYPH|nr:methyltransferase domain-containing protein [Methylobacterium crusticola]GJD50508.1 2-methoxy-6-polyprenyl-1,4-benzoquinol methylase, mitochondrial [Methylobacterium crusticola]
MRRLHFDALKPACPTCRRALLALEPGAESADDTIRSGLLRCQDNACGERFPIIAGTPVLVPNLAGWLSANLHLMLESDIDVAVVESVVGAVVGPESAYNIARQQQSSYAHDHYGDLFEADPDAGTVSPGGVRRCLDRALRHLGPVRGPVLDVGCAVGRTSFDIAAACDGPVLGVDLNWPLLRIGRGVLDRGLLRYPLRRLGNRYDRRDTHFSPPEGARVDFWVIDAQALPFADNTFDLVVALNVLDCVPDPTQLVVEISRVAAPGGGVALAAPLDWAPHATPYPAWLDSPAAFENMVARASRAAPGAKPLTPLAPAFNLPWAVRLHDNATVTYKTQLLTLTAAET